MRELFAARDGQVFHGDSCDGLPGVEMFDCLITDPPYGSRTHEGHDGSAKRDPSKMPNPEKLSRPLDYPTWTPAEVARACNAWHPRTKGWICVMTDHVLARAWEAELERHGRYVFAPLPCYSPGSRVRLAGDGPSSWTVWLVVARPRCKPWSTWGTLPGGYVYRPEPMPLVGGKPVALMRAIVSDYSKPGDLVLDPCCGAGSTLEAARDLGRRWLGIDISEEHAKMAAGRMGSSMESGPLFEERK